MLIGAPDLSAIRTLQYPDAAALAEAWRVLPRQGSCFLTCRSEELAVTLAALERAGFHGLQINPAGLAMRSVEVRAWKGKQGPCFATGRSARYLGLAAAALDDDHHLLLADAGSADALGVPGTAMPVCEKTAQIYLGAAYQGLVAVDEADPGLVARLDRDPVPFDCATLERDAATLAARLPPPDGGPRVPVLYGGPFRLLILADGTLLRRGQVSPVPAALAGPLRREGATAAAAGEPIPAQFFPQLHAAQGAACLLGELPLADSFSAPVALRWEALADTDAEMRTRLQKLITRGDKQFVLTGSDPRVQWGCCPSDAVHQANRLVEAGILMCWSAPLPPDACPTTLYAFAGELRAVAGRPQAQIDATFRAAVLARLG